ncbi:unnamed protein product, partial [Polarella glacialis]
FLLLPPSAAAESLATDSRGNDTESVWRGADGRLWHRKTLSVSQCIRDVDVGGVRYFGGVGSAVRWQPLATSIRRNLAIGQGRGWRRLGGLALRHHVCRKKHSIFQSCLHNAECCPLGVATSHLLMLLSRPESYGFDIRLLSSLSPAHRWEQLSVSTGYFIWNAPAFRLIDILYSGWPMFALLRELRRHLPRLWEVPRPEMDGKPVNDWVKQLRLAYLGRSRANKKMDPAAVYFKASIALCATLNSNGHFDRTGCSPALAEQALGTAERALRQAERSVGHLSASAAAVVEAAVERADKHLKEFTWWIQAPGDDFRPTSAKLVAAFLIATDSVLPQLESIQRRLDRLLSIRVPSSWTTAESGSPFEEQLEHASFCPAIVVQQGVLSAEASYVRDFHAAMQPLLSPPQSRATAAEPYFLQRPSRGDNLTSREAWVVFLWGGASPQAQKAALLHAEVVRTLAHSVRRAEAPLRRAFIVFAVGPLPEPALQDLEADGLEVRLLRENETLPMWQQEFIRKPANMGAWFQDRGLAAVFAQVAAWSLEEFHRVVVLDADTLMLRNCDELFDLGRLSFAASPETHKDQEDITQSGGKLRTYLLNAGVMSIRPNAELLGQLRLSVQQPEFRWAVERIGVNGEPNFQALIDSFLQDRSLRHGLAVWSPRGGFEGCIHKVPATGSRNKDYNNNNFFKDSNSNSNNINNNNNNNNNNNRKASGDLASSWQLGGADHCLLPVDYNFFVDFPHVFFAAYTFRDEAFRGSAAHSASDAVWDSPRLAVFNATVRWLRNSGMLSAPEPPGDYNSYPMAGTPMATWGGQPVQGGGQPFQDGPPNQSGQPAQDGGRLSQGKDGWAGKSAQGEQPAQGSQPAQWGQPAQGSDGPAQGNDGRGGGPARDGQHAQGGQPAQGSDGDPMAKPGSDPWANKGSQANSGGWDKGRQGGGHHQKTGGASHRGSGHGGSYRKGDTPVEYPPIHNNRDKNNNLPVFVQPMVRADDFNSMFLIDTREATDAFEGRVLDPFNNLLPQVAAMNAVTNQKRAGPYEAPNGATTTRGAHLAVFMVQTTETHKWTWAVTMDADEMNMGGTWDEHMLQVFKRPSFAPMAPPKMANKSVAAVDLKLRYKKYWVSRLVLKAYQGEQNMTPETCAVNEDALDIAMNGGQIDPKELDLQLVVYKGVNVTAYTFGPETPVISMGPKGAVFKLSYPRVTFECRKVLKTGQLTMGMDGDRFSFLFRDHTNGLNLRGSRTSAPSDWVLISNPKNMALDDTCQMAREAQARVEGPDPIYEPAQLWTAHQRWMGQDQGAPNDPRLVVLDDQRLPGAKRFQYDRHLTMDNQIANFHAAFTRGPVAMNAVAASQTNLALPDYKDNGEEKEVDLDEVRPWGEAKPADLVQAQRTPTWVRSLLSEQTTNLLTLSQPLREPWEDAELAPQPRPQKAQTPNQSPEEETQGLSPGEEVEGSQMPKVYEVETCMASRSGLWEEYRTWVTWGFAQGSNSASKRKEPGSDPLAPAGSRRDQLKSAATTAMALVPVEILEAESGQTLSTTGLQDKERRRKALAVANLLMMIERAGAGSLLRTSMEQKYQDLAPAMMEAALSRGAPGTIEGHVLRWKAFERWALIKNRKVYPPETFMVALYMRAWKEESCGPSVPDAIKTTVRWVCKKLEMKEPDLNAEEILGIRDQVREEAGKALKEAPAVPEQVIVAMEVMVCANGNNEMRAFAWYLLCMIYASLRFDDANHVGPNKLDSDNMDHALYGISWQTKTERTRRGVKFAVPNASMSGNVWLEVGYQAFKKEHMNENRRDYWMPNRKMTRNQSGQVAMVIEKTEPMKYQDSLVAAKYVMLLALIRTGKDAPEIRQQIKELTWHSMKVTMLQAMAAAETDPLAIVLQGHWKDPKGAMVLKYARNRLAIPVRTIKVLTERAARAWRPNHEPEDGPIVDYDSDNETNQFYIAITDVTKLHLAKYHAESLRVKGKTACLEFDLRLIEHVGPECPDAQTLCKACATNRPDLQEL